MENSKKKRLTPAEHRLLELNIKVLKENGRYEPPDVAWDDLQVVLNTAFAESGRRITNLDELAALAKLEEDKDEDH